MSTIRSQAIDIAARAVHRTRFDHVPPGHYMLERAPVSRENRDAACIWIGEMQAYNGGITIEEIVRLAGQALMTQAIGAECTAILFRTETHRDDLRLAIDLPAFIRALVGEGIWRGSKRAVGDEAMTRQPYAAHLGIEPSRIRVRLMASQPGNVWVVRAVDRPDRGGWSVTEPELDPPSWFDDHPRFVLPPIAQYCQNCNQGSGLCDDQKRRDVVGCCYSCTHDSSALGARYFTVPPLTLPHATEVEG